MQPPRVIPALADLTQDIAGAVPVELLQSWALGDKDPLTAESLLEPFRLVGTVVSSDTSGLSRMTQELDLLDVMQMISRPKELIHGLGTEIGGRPVGIWTADNTQMFYARDLSVATVLDAMSEAQLRIADVNPVGVGLAVHTGVFHEIGGGLYGHDADLVERLAEDYAVDGQILVTETVREAIQPELPYRFELLADLRQLLGQPIYLTQSTKRLPALRGLDDRYPHPFTEEFFELLRCLRDPTQAQHARKKISEDYVRPAVVVFVFRSRRSGRSDLDLVLENLLADALLATIVSESAATERVAGCAGGRAILTFNEPDEALTFALEVRQRFRDNELEVGLGIDAGPVVIFDGHLGASGISGDPVNIASKLSEDSGQPSRIRITRRVAEHLSGIPAHEQFSLTASGVAITGITL